MGMDLTKLVDQERELPRQAPAKILAFCALHQMGCDWKDMVRGLGLDRPTGITVRELDRAANIHRMLTWGLPPMMFADLVSAIRCPRCGRWIDRAPCFQCCSEGAWPSTMTDALCDLSDF
jgi:hypothetical protein